MRKNVKVFNLLVCVILVLSMFTAVPANAGNEATVNATSLNVREKPSISAKMLGSLKNGEKVTVLKTQNGWSNISYKGGTAWVSAEFLKMSSIQPPKNDTTTRSKSAKVTATSLNVRKGPGLNNNVIGSLKNGTIVTVVKEDGKWSSITYGKVSGWVSNAYLIDQLGSTKPADTTSKPSNPSNPPSSNQTQGKWAKVTATYLNFRSSGNLSAPIIGSLKYGTDVLILSESNGWCSVQTKDGKKGWVSKNYLAIQQGESPVVVVPVPESKPPAAPPSTVNKMVVVMENGVNIRQGPSTSYLVVGTANQGDEFAYIQSKNDWVQLKLPNGQNAWIAGWLVAVQEHSKPQDTGNPPISTAGLKGKRIVIDPGHGGYDPGTQGNDQGTHESQLTLMTARLLATELSKAGANVILTRSDDSYISLNKRVQISHYYFADAFISLHYNSAADQRASGILTFYYGQKDIQLANAVHNGIAQAKTGLSTGNVRFGDFHVVRENKQPAILVELGFLSNSFDEMTVKSNSFQSKAAQGITNGLATYFK